MNSRMSQADDLRCVVGQCVEEQILSEFPIHGNTSWTPYRLAVTALLWSWSAKDALTQRFREARGIAESLLQTNLPQHWQGFLKKLRADHSQLKHILTQTLRKTGRNSLATISSIKRRPKPCIMHSPIKQMESYRGYGNIGNGQETSR